MMVTRAGQKAKSTRICCLRGSTGEEIGAAASSTINPREEVRIGRNLLAKRPYLWSVTRSYRIARVGRTCGSRQRGQSGPSFASASKRIQQTEILTLTTDRYSAYLP